MARIIQKEGDVVKVFNTAEFEKTTGGMVEVKVFDKETTLAEEVEKKDKIISEIDKLQVLLGKQNEFIAEIESL